MDAYTERAKAIQANYIAGIIFDRMHEHDPDYYVTVALRYGIADAIWDAGYRKVVS